MTSTGTVVVGQRAHPQPQRPSNTPCGTRGCRSSRPPTVVTEPVPDTDTAVAAQA
jgi:hypothetical protein